MAKPVVICLSSDDDFEFKWLSGGWNETKNSDTPEAKRLFALAKSTIKAGSDVKDVVDRLEKAGFTVSREA